MDKQTFKEMIVQSATAKRMIGTVSPIYEDSYVGSWLFEIIGREWDRIWKIIDELPDQLFPQTATWLLSMWEERYGITPNIGDDDETRRSRVIEAEAPPAPFTPFVLNRWVYANSRREIKIDEHVAPYTFGVTITSHPDSLPLDLDKLRKYINNHKHSHMSYTMMHTCERRITIKRETMYWKTSHTLCGTKPYRNVEVGIDTEGLTVSGSGAAYISRFTACGTRTTGGSIL